MKKLLIEYYSSNSGGRDWLNEEQWKKLEKAGWRLFGFDNVAYEGNDYKLDKDGLPEKTGETDRYKYAFKRFDTPKEALLEFEELTGEDTTAEGCNCCGPPHCFSWVGGYVSGEECSEYLLGEDLSKVSKRELYQKLKLK